MSSSVRVHAHFLHFSLVHTDGTVHLGKECILLKVSRRNIIAENFGPFCLDGPPFRLC